MKANSKLVQVQDRFLLEAFRAHSYNRTRTANYLGCGLRTLQRSLKRLGIPEGSCQMRWDESEREPIAKAVDEVLSNMPVIKVS